MGKANHEQNVQPVGVLNDVVAYHKYVDNLLLHNPDPKATHWQPVEDRFNNKGFAEEDRQKRIQEREHKQAVIEKKR